MTCYICYNVAVQLQFTLVVNHLNFGCMFVSIVLQARSTRVFISIGLQARPTRVFVSIVLQVRPTFFTEVSLACETIVSTRSALQSDHMEFQELHGYSDL